LAVPPLDGRVKPGHDEEGGVGLRRAAGELLVNCCCATNVPGVLCDRKFVSRGGGLRHIAVMISVVVPTLNAQATLPRCFDSLIAATVHGVVREVIVADGGSADDTLAIADAAGARIKKGGKSRASQLVTGAAAARHEWLLFLQPATALAPGWEVEAEAFIARSTLERPSAAAFRFGLDEFDSGARRAETLAALRCWLFKLPYGDQGLLIPKRFYKHLGGYRDKAREDIDLVRRIGARRLVMLRSRAVNKKTVPQREMPRVAVPLEQTARQE
jgi:glycosyltransferase involved in cell wall biosynthesis